MKELITKYLDSLELRPWIQASKETDLLKFLDLLDSTRCKHLFMTSFGVLYLSTFLGLLFKQSWICLISASDIVSKLVPLGKYLRISPLVFSLRALSHDLYGLA